MELSQLQYDVLREYKSFMDSISIHGLPKSLEREYDDLMAKRPKFIVAYDPLQRTISYRPLLVTTDNYTSDGYIIFDEDSTTEHLFREPRLVMLPVRLHRF